MSTQEEGCRTNVVFKFLVWRKRLLKVICDKNVIRSVVKIMIVIKLINYLYKTILSLYLRTTRSSHSLECRRDESFCIQDATENFHTVLLTELVVNNKLLFRRKHKWYESYDENLHDIICRT
jgi:hypothetical protein